MKRRVKVVITVLAGLALLMVFAVAVLMIRMNNQVNDFDTTSIDVTKVADGLYEGHSETDLVKADVRVTVLNGEIKDIEIVRHMCGKGKPAEAMTESMILNNDVEVDAVSGATYSSMVIKDAVRNALRKGL